MLRSAILEIILIHFPFFEGTVKFGLTTLCQESIDGGVTCISPNLPESWKATLGFVILAVLTLTLTCSLIVASFWKPKAFDYGKWVAVIACKYRYNEQVSLLTLSRELL